MMARSKARIGLRIGLRQRLSALSYRLLVKLLGSIIHSCRNKFVLAGLLIVLFWTWWMIKLHDQPAKLISIHVEVIDPKTGVASTARRVYPGDVVRLTYFLYWRDRCPLEVQPTIIGSGGGRITLEKFVLRRPDVLGESLAQHEFKMTALPPGPVTYVNNIRSLCWYDIGPLARRFQARSVQLTMAPWTQQLKK